MRTSRGRPCWSRRRTGTIQRRLKVPWRLVVSRAGFAVKMDTQSGYPTKEKAPQIVDLRGF